MLVHIQIFYANFVSKIHDIHSGGMRQVAHKGEVEVSWQNQNATSVKNCRDWFGVF